jgi:hypothetical protein
MSAEETLKASGTTFGGAVPEEPSPIWVVVRSTVPRHGLPRNHVATVDITDPVIQHELRASWIVPLPANEQPGGVFDFNPRRPLMAKITEQVNVNGEWADAIESSATDENNRTFWIIDGATGALHGPQTCSRGEESGQFRTKA